MLIRREVFEKLSQPWFEYNSELAEDAYICKRARDAGFEIKVVTSVKLDQMGFFTLQHDGKFRWYPSVFSNYVNC
jgi:hypothetical protein